MSSTYSPNLRIELIQTGEQSGTWGSTTNTNLGTLIESAISGYTSVVVSGDQALTAANGTADQARNMVIEFTGAIAGNYNIFIPPAEKFYVFRNSTTSVSNYTLTISASTTLNGTTPTGGTTVTIPAGKTMMLFCDATNVHEAIDRVNGNFSIGGTLTANALTLASAPLSVSNGGTGVVNITAGTIPRGNGTAPLSAASGADIVANIGSVAVQNATTAANIAGGAANRIPYNTAADTTGFIPAPTASAQYLNYDGVSLNWNTLPASGVLSVTASAPLASSGGANPNISVSGTLGVSNGGTGASTLAANNVLLGNGTSAVQTVAPGTSGNVLISNGTTWTASPGFVAGMIMMWSGATTSIPAGWALCDGTLGTPNLRDKFIVGAGTTYAVGATGGSKDAVVVSHSHTFSSGTTNTTGAHTHTYSFGLADNNNDNGTLPAAGLLGSNLRTSDTFTTASSGDHSHTVTGTISTTGVSGTNANLPPYYALAFIMKL